MKKTILCLLGALLASSLAMTASAQLTVGGLNQNGADVDNTLPPPTAAALAKRAKVLSTTSMLQYEWIVEGPVREHPDFNAWSAWMTDYIYNHGHPPTNEVFRGNINSGHVSEPSSNPAKTFWCVIRAISRTGADIWANNFIFRSWSSDNWDYLGTITGLTNLNTVWSARLLGVTGPGTVPRSNDSVLVTGRLSDTPVREVIFIGAQIPYFTYADVAGSNAVNSFIIGHTNWRVSGKWSYVVNGVTNSYSVKSLDTTLVVTNLPQLSISANQLTHEVTLGVNADVGESVVVKYYPEVTSSGSVLSTVNHGDTWTFQSTNQAPRGFYKAERY